MAKQYPNITDKLKGFIQAQRIFFVATATPAGHINLSPKGMDSLRIVDTNTVMWLNVTGSGNETAAHVLEDGRMTLMFCAFEGDPMILRLYGQARVIHPRDAEWPDLLAQFPPLPGARQIFQLQVEMAQTSCGMGVPLLDFVADRDGLIRWAEKKGPEGVVQYWQEKNRVSLDGKGTGI